MTAPIWCLCVQAAFSELSIEMGWCQAGSRMCGELLADGDVSECNTVRVALDPLVMLRCYDAAAS